MKDSIYIKNNRLKTKYTYKSMKNIAATYVLLSALSLILSVIGFIWIDFKIALTWFLVSFFIFIISGMCYRVIVDAKNEVDKRINP